MHQLYCFATDVQHVKVSFGRVIDNLLIARGQPAAGDTRRGDQHAVGRVAMHRAGKAAAFDGDGRREWKEVGSGCT